MTTVDWQNERYVRLYTRTTADLLAIGWEGRLVWYELLRHVDRAGVIDTRGDIQVVPELIRVPGDVFERGLPRITERGMVEITPASLVIPNFLEAQESPQSDAQRKRESRARRRDQARRNNSENTKHVTNSDTLSETQSNQAKPGANKPEVAVNQPEETMCPPAPNVTTRDSMGSQNVSETSRAVTSSHSVPSRAVPSRAVPSLKTERGQLATFDANCLYPLPGEDSLSEAKQRTLARYKATALEIWQRQDQIRREVIPNARALAPTAERVLLIAERLNAGATPDECEHVLQVYASEAATTSPPGRWLNGTTPWRAENFTRALGQSPAPANGARRRQQEWTK